ncbi:hypothetical protein Btru_027167 [Bulinus truncatus]|nr:hypothetical protein Btru_027167 [Bulinus truncatus]
MFNKTTICWKNFTSQTPGEANQSDLICCQVENGSSYDQHLLNLIKVHIVMSCFCIAFVTVTLCLLLRFKHGNSKRATIHANLLAAFFIYAVVIQFFLLAVYLQVVHGIGNAISMMCVSAISRHYTLVSVYTWMLIEGIYLHVLVTTPFKVEKIPTHVFCLFGWGLPLVFTVCWSILTAKQTDGCSLGWTDLTMFTYILILCPIVFILLINFLMLLNLLRIVVTKLCRDRVSECQKICSFDRDVLYPKLCPISPRQSIKATVVLTFLLGIINVSLIPADDINGPESYIASIIPYLQRHDSYNHDIYNHDSYNHDSYNHDSYNHDSYTHDSYNHDSYNHDSYNHGSYNHDSYNHDSPLKKKKSI